MRTFILILSTFLLLNCQETENFPPCAYRNNAGISDSSGIPLDSAVFYFEPLTFKDTSAIPIWTIDAPYDSVFNSQGSINMSDIPEHAFHEEYQIEIDTFWLELLSKYLYRNDERILSNYFLGDTIYRFTWIRSFNRSKIITLTSSGDNYELTTKFLPFYDDSLTIEKSLVSREHFTKFTRLVDELRFFEITSVDNEIPGNDGEEWLLEVHYPNCYHFVTEWSGNLDEDPELETLGRYLIDLSEQPEN